MAKAVFVSAVLFSLSWSSHCFQITGFSPSLFGATGQQTILPSFVPHFPRAGCRAQRHMDCAVPLRTGLRSLVSSSVMERTQQSGQFVGIGQILDRTRKPFTEDTLSFHTTTPKFLAHRTALDLNNGMAEALIRECSGAFNLAGGVSSFFLGTHEQPQCCLEKMAQDIFRHYTRDIAYDPACSGVEWWVQMRVAGDGEHEDIKLHWDKDEELATEHGIHAHPKFGTVTYLTNYGAPTLILDRDAPYFVEDIEKTLGPVDQGWVSFPRAETSLSGDRNGAPNVALEPVYFFVDTSTPLAGKHIAFDGNLLHGAPAGVVTDRQTTYSGDFRVTFLANVWVDNMPMGVPRFPKEMLHRFHMPVASAPSWDFSDPSGPETLQVAEISRIVLPGELGAAGGEGGAVAAGRDVREVTFGAGRKLQVPAPLLPASFSPREADGASFHVMFGKR